MSTKTIKQRIAGVAVTALGAGLLSVVPISSVQAAAPTANTLHVVGNFNGPAALTTSADNATSGEGSQGLLNASGSGTTQTAVLLPTGTLLVVGGAGSTITNKTSIVVTGGTVIKAFTTGATAAYISTDSTTAISASTAGTLVGSAATIAAQIKPNSGVTSMTVSYYYGASVAVATPTSGTLGGRVTVTVTSSDNRLAYASTYSYVNTAAITATGTSTGAGAASSTVDGVDQTGGSTPANRDSGFMNFTLADAYGSALDGEGAVTIEATNGGLVKFSTTLGTGSAATASLDVTTDTSGTVTVTRPAASLDKAFNTTVTIKYNGVSVGTKSFTFVGEVATMTASKPVISRTGATNTDQYRVVYADNAGNALYPQSGTSSVSGVTNATITSTGIGTYGVAATATAAKGTVVCAGTAGSYADAGSATLQLQHVNSASGTVIKSNTWTQKCAGDAYTFAASWDKAVYTPGSVAKLSITFKDAAGNLANSVNNVSSTSSLIEVTGGPSTTYVTAPANGDKAGVRDADADGVKSYQFTVGSTEGDFTAVVAVPVVKTANSAAANQSLSYSVKASSSTVTNAEVLKSIVALIASINKQIQALQKLILARR